MEFVPCSQLDHGLCDLFAPSLFSMSILSFAFLSRAFLTFMCTVAHTIRSNENRTIKTLLYTHPYLMGRYKRAWMHFSHNQTLASKSQRCRRRQRQSWITFKVKWQVILFNSYLLCARQSDFRLVSLLSFETLMNLNRNCKEKEEEEDKLNAFMGNRCMNWVENL